MMDTHRRISGKHVSFRGVMDHYARFIEENQLLLEEDWHLFVNQFRSGVDDADAGWRGEYFGKMMRGAAMTYRYTKNEKLYALFELAVRHNLIRTKGDFAKFIGIERGTLSHAFANDEKAKIIARINEIDFFISNPPS